MKDFLKIIVSMIMMICLSTPIFCFRVQLHPKSVEKDIRFAIATGDRGTPERHEIIPESHPITVTDLPSDNYVPRSINLRWKIFIGKSSVPEAYLNHAPAETMSLAALQNPNMVYQIAAGNPLPPAKAGSTERIDVRYGVPISLFFEELPRPESPVAGKEAVVGKETPAAGKDVISNLVKELTECRKQLADAQKVILRLKAYMDENYFLKIENEKLKEHVAPPSYESGIEPKSPPPAYLTPPKHKGTPKV